MFRSESGLYRSVSQSYEENYQCLNQSGLYNELASNHLLVSHREVESIFGPDSSAYRVLQPEPIPFISYPYEWSFSQLKDAALLTLDIIQRSLHRGMILKDASSYNIQFMRGKPIFIDSLSFEKYTEGNPWRGYRQFIQHFFLPLGLMSYRDVRLNQLLRVHIDGIPLELGSSLLPLTTRLNFSFLLHVHLHAKLQARYSADKIPSTKRHGSVSKQSLLGMISNLRRSIESLQWAPKGTEWGDYYQATNYTHESFNEKLRLVQELLTTHECKSLWDIGGNTGRFSRIASELGIPTICFDIDPAAVDLNYRQVRSQNETHLLPLLLDLTNPSSNIGWANQERDSLLDRGPADTVLALALIHHLAISNRVPFTQIAAFMSKIGKRLIIEFVPKEDSQCQRLLSHRDDLFPNYHQQQFESDFQKFFKILQISSVPGSCRTLYLMQKI